MRLRLLMTALPWLLLLCCGCCFGPTVDTVPWWKGVPSLLIEPASLEATVWRDHLRAKYGGLNRSATPDYVSHGPWEDASFYEPIPVPAVEPEHLLPPPAATQGDMDQHRSIENEAILR